MGVVKGVWDLLKRIAWGGVGVITWWFDRIGNSQSRVGKLIWALGGTVVLFLCMCWFLTVVLLRTVEATATPPSVAEGDVLEAIQEGTATDTPGSTMTAEVSVTVTETAVPSLTPTERPTATSPPTFTPAPAVEVVNRSVNVRVGPGLNYAVRGRLRQGDTAAIVAQTAEGDWFNVRLDDGRLVWIAAGAVTRMGGAVEIAATIPAAPPTDTAVPATATGTATMAPTATAAAARGTAVPVPGSALAPPAPVAEVVFSSVNVRAGPGTDYAVVGVLQEGERSVIVARTTDGGWFVVRLDDGRLVWIAASVVTTNVDAIARIAVAATIPAGTAPASSPSDSTAATQPPPPPPTQAVAVCECSGNIYNCGHFGSHAAAQACFAYCIEQGRGDIHRLDGDNDGIACESLP
jgi:uncharacterized protein YgiM (DUF1202 family)